MGPEHSAAPPLPSDSSDALADLWRFVLRSADRDIGRDLLRTVARQVSFGAHRSNVRAEQLIVAVRASWVAHTGLFESRRRQWVLSEVISMCIEAFYSTQHDSAALESVANRPARHDGQEHNSLRHGST
jgi:hypothetical protein